MTLPLLQQTAILAFMSNFCCTHTIMHRLLREAT